MRSEIHSVENMDQMIDDRIDFTLGNKLETN